MAKIPTDFNPKNNSPEKPDIEAVAQVFGIEKRIGGVCPVCGDDSKGGRRFHLYPETRSFYCFSCGAGGDAFDLLKAAKGLDFKAAKELIEAHGIPNGNGGDGPGYGGEERKPSEPERKVHKGVTLVLGDLAKLCHAALSNEMREHVKSHYGLSDETIDSYLIGFCPPGEESKQELMKRYSIGELKAAGILTKKGSSLLQGRIIFPYWRGGAVVYAIGRKTSQTPAWSDGKYIKLATTEYVKNQWLYGEDSLGDSKTAYVAEGVTDCLAALQAGLPCISPVTTRFSNADLPVLTKLVQGRSVYLIPDSEKSGAGMEGALSTRDYLLRSGIPCAIVELPRPEDKDKIDLNEYLRDHGIEAFEKLLPPFDSPQGGGSDWMDPEPLENSSEKELSYPIDSFPPAMRDAVLEYQTYGQQPLALVATSALSALSLAAQGIVDVARDERLKGPVSINAIMCGNSGERKTKADEAFSKPAMEWQRRKAEEMQPELEEYRAAERAWKSEVAGIQKAIEKAAGKGEDTSGLKERLADMEQNRPQAPKIPYLFFEDATPQGLARDLAERWYTGSLWSDEAGTVFGGIGASETNLMGLLSLLNKLWDGLTKPFSPSRKVTQTFTLDGRRFCASLMLQEVVLRDLVERGGGLAKGMGFLGRFLICQPESTIGARPYREPGEMKSLARFHRRLEELLEEPLSVDEKDRLRPKVLHLSTEAKRIWIQFHDDCEKELGAGREFCGVTENGAKTPEQAARIAALFHVFEHGPAGDIGPGHMESGCAVAAYYLHEAKRLFTQLETSKDISEAKELLDWILRYGKGEEVSAGAVLTHGPNRMRSRSRRDALLAILEEKGWLAVESGEKNRLVIMVNPKATQ